LNETTPPWRAFSSEASDTAGAPETVAQRRAIPRWLAPLLAGLGGLGLGVAAIGFVALAADVVAAGRDVPAVEALDAPVAVESVLEPAPSGIVVDVAGAVARPGLHRLRPGDRVGDAIEAAGGFAPRADLTASSATLNLAQPLEDGSKVLVPELGIDPPSGGPAVDDGRIDINHASGSELETLPGIGPVTAGKIIDARASEPFGSVDELRSRGLVGEKVYEDIQGLVRTS
jgi:competence protein ComEA